ncbi:alpha-amylase [Neolewinella aurantiaca]|uniref:Alpha-amylase n=1 Tax=Neolewinella aurantiaca TaxID=2602767 RepID=A0A5C7FNL8_9BACT|nr:glycoside hydrolase family 13 protein [Neolewinella aurantiaca]TXF91825.1 alpha-amylase [Neolewinella aurantiaca]
MKTLLLLALAIGALNCFAQDPAVYNDDPMQQRALGQPESEYFLREPTGLENPDNTGVFPPNWWTNMEEPALEIMVHEKDIAAYTSVAVQQPGVSVEYVSREANPNYLFIGLRISPGTKPCSLKLELASRGRAPKTITYELLPHPRKDWVDRDQLGPQDMIYLVMPDRFANGDPSNDVVAGTHDTLLNRQKFFFRHGGDLQGIINKLDYLHKLGVTALWLNPVLENNQAYASYHGYAVTDHYSIDPRLGDNEKYKELVAKAHEKGIKVIMDVIFNHVGDQHYLMRDLPGTDWIHQWPEYTKTTYRAPTLLDPNASEYDRKLMTDGWFDKHMPDLNQQNKHVANYLIQNSIWWTLWSNQDAYRIDTYAYADGDFAAEWNRRLLQEIPHLGIYGETWMNGIGIQAWFAGGRKLHEAFDTNLPGVTDFQLYHAIHEALGRDPGWAEGVNRLYYTLAQDYLYEDPSRNVIFLDNHDVARVFTSLGEDVTKMKSAFALLLTMRGIPMLYYGAEVGLTGAGGSFGEGGRVDFPGGWPGDKTDLFTSDGRNATQAALHEFVSSLATYRRASKALSTGKLTQFVPRDGVYVYFRHQGDETVMVVFNGNNEAVSLDDLSPYQEMVGGYKTGLDLTRGKESVSLQKIGLAGKEARVLLLQ